MLALVVSLVSCGHGQDLADELRGIISYIAFWQDSEMNMLRMTQGKRCGDCATATTYYNSSACAILR